VIALFFMLGWDRYGFDEKCVGARYTEVVFLHPMGSAGHIVHSAASMERNMIARFFMLGWDRYRFNKKCVGRCYNELVFLHPVGSAGNVGHLVCLVGAKCRRTFFHAREGLVQFP
jgi:hypothetical protein